MEEKDLLFCTCIGRRPLPLPSYLCNPANALGLSMEEKDLLLYLGRRVGEIECEVQCIVCHSGCK